MTLSPGNAAGRKPRGRNSLRLPRGSGSAMRPHLAVLLVLVASLAHAAPATPLDDDAGSGADAPDTALPLVEVVPGRVYEGALLGFPLDLDDYFVFHGGAGDVLHAAAAGSFGCVTILSSAGDTLDSSCVAGVQLVAIRAVLPSAGAYYLRYEALEPDRYWFSLGVGDDAPPVPAGPQDDAGSGRDAPDEPWPAVPVEAGRVYQATLLGPAQIDDVADHYTFEGHAGQVLDVVASGDLACVAILDAAGATLAESCITWTFQKDPLRAVLPADGRYYVRYASLWPQPYWFALGVGAPARGIPTELQDDAGSGRDAPDVPTPLVEIRSGGSYQGLAAPDTVLDWRDHYLFHGNAGDAVDVLATGEDACSAILDAAGAELARRCPGAEGQQHTLRAILPADGDYYFQYFSFEPAQYWFSLGVGEDAPDLLLDVQDDAGSGRDAPAEPAPRVRIEPGRVYEATVLGELVDREDFYAFEGRAGDVVHVRASASGLAFVDVVDAAGARLAGTLVGAHMPLSAVRVALPADGTYYVRYEQDTADRYWLSLGVGSDAPRLPVPQPWTLT